MTFDRMVGISMAEPTPAHRNDDYGDNARDPVRYTLL